MPEIFPIIYGVLGPPIQFGAAPKYSNLGGEIVKTLSVLRDSRIMRDNLRMTDNG